MELKVIEENDGLWTKEYSIGDFFGFDKESLCIELRSPTNMEYIKLQTVEAEMAKNTGPDMIEVDVSDEDEGENNKDKASDKRRTIAVSMSGIQKRKEFLLKLVEKCTVNHNFAKKDKNGVIVKRSTKEVWLIIDKCIPAAKYIIEDWRASFPLVSEPAEK